MLESSPKKKKKKFVILDILSSSPRSLYRTGRHILAPIFSFLFYCILVKDYILILILVQTEMPKQLNTNRLLVKLHECCTEGCMQGCPATVLCCS